jgi:saccharopine dehydrogenase-like NADP-dependent oxidoreductase
MSKVAVIGVGQMGKVITWAMKSLGHYVIGLDTHIGGDLNFQSIPGLNGTFYRLDENKKFSQAIAYEQPEVVISSLPYHQTEKVGNWCVDNGYRYCDLGGKVSVSKSINDRAKNRAMSPVMTDLGLAPGWVNILAEEGYRKLYGGGDIVSVEMMVGGLPDYLESNKNPLRYGVTWSIDGLINEYKDDCIILENGMIYNVRGMDGLEAVETEKLGRLESFYTSGGASHTIESMKDRGVKNCSYKTLRYPGHRNIIKFLIRDCELDDETLEQVFVNGCGYADKDEVIIIAKVHKDNKTWSKEKLIKADEKPRIGMKKGFSAMQKATAFPVASVASLMAEGYFDGKKSQCRGYWDCFNKSLSYADIPYEEFNKKIKKLNAGP